MLAQAAGVAASWRDVDGAEHAVPRETIEALLAALHLPADSLSQARESLALLARRGGLRSRLVASRARHSSDRGVASNVRATTYVDVAV